MIAGYLPFRVDVPDTSPEYRRLLFAKITRSDPTFPVEISPPLLNLLQGIFKKNPTERYTIEKVSRHQWLAGLQLPVLRVPTFVDPEALGQLKALSLDVKQIEIDILRDEFTAGTAMYRTLVREKLAETVRNENIVTSSQSSSKLMGPPIVVKLDKRRKSMGTPVRVRAAPGAQTVQVVALKSKPSSIHARLAPVFAGQPGRLGTPV
jgi:serine/threonine protein kinase